jgi:hypothetical protein
MFQDDEQEPQVSPLRYPGFPVEFGGVADLHAAFLNESRTRGHVQRLRGRKSGYAPVEMTNLSHKEELSSRPERSGVERPAVPVMQ